MLWRSVGIPQVGKILSRSTLLTAVAVPFYMGILLPNENAWKSSLLHIYILEKDINFSWDVQMDNLKILAYQISLINLISPTLFLKRAVPFEM